MCKLRRITHKHSEKPWDAKQWPSGRNFVSASHTNVRFLHSRKNHKSKITPLLRQQEESLFTKWGDHNSRQNRHGIKHLVQTLREKNGSLAWYNKAILSVGELTEISVPSELNKSPYYFACFFFQIIISIIIIIFIILDIAFLNTCLFLLMSLASITTQLH